MERMLVVVFDDKTKAFEASKTLTQLDADGDISIYAEAVVKKNADNTVSIEQSSDVFPIGTVTGTAIGALIDLLGDVPDVGAAGGAAIGNALDLDRAGVNAEFLSDVSSSLRPGEWAVVSDISEEITTPVDSQMKALGGHVFRQTRESVEDEQNEREVRAIQSDIKELDKEEKAEARAEKKAELKAKVEALHDKLHNKLELAKIRSEEREKETQAKVKYLQQKLAKAQGNMKTKIENRVHEIRKQSPAAETAVAQN